MFVGDAACEDGVAAVGQYKYPRCIPRGEVMLHVIRFSKGRGATALETWYCLETRRACQSSRVVQKRHLHRYIGNLQGFSGEDAEKSSTETDQGVDHRSRKSERFSDCRVRRLPYLVLHRLPQHHHPAKRAIAYGHIGYNPPCSCFLRSVFELQEYMVMLQLHI